MRSLMLRSKTMILGCYVGIVALMSLIARWQLG